MLQLRRRGKGNRIPNVVAAGTGATPAAFYLGLCRLCGILSPPASATVILQEGRSSAQLRWCCRRAVLSCSSDDAASIPKSGLEIKNQCTKEGVNGEKLASIRKSEPEIKNRCTKEGINRQNLASIRKSEPEIKNRCTLEGINRQNLASIPKFDPEIKNRCTKEGVNGENLASIRKSEPEIKNRCTKEGINRQNLASIRKSEPEIKNRCTLEGINRQNLASIPKFDPEIKNQCSRGVVAVCRRNHSPLPLRKLESDAALVAATTTAGGPFFSAAKKIRIRRGDSLQKAAHPQTIPQHAFHHALPTRLALDVCMGTGSTQVRQWRQKRMRPEAAFPYVSAAEGTQHPPKKPPRSTIPATTKPHKTTRNQVATRRNENKHKKQYLC